MKQNVRYQQGHFLVEQVRLDRIAAETGTPAYVYSEASFAQQLGTLQSAFAKIGHMICFSMKVCHNSSVVRFFVERGCGLDIVSGGELHRALRAGCSPQKIVYSGVGKTESELRAAIDAGVLQINIESEQELERIDRVARERRRRVAVAFRVNPNVDPETHPYISTGLQQNKFGIDHKMVLPLYRRAKRMKNIEVVGIDYHIGSQILKIAPFRDALRLVAQYVRRLASEGIRLRFVDVGGGLGIPYRRGEKAVAADEYARAITEAFADLPNITFLLEPGRFLAAAAGFLLARVQYVKRNSAGRRFVIVDTGMHHLLRPPLYGGFHAVRHEAPPRGTRKQRVDVVGPICESTDFIIKDYPLEPVKQGDLLVIENVGAYCSVLASHYNSHPIPVEVLVSGKRFRVIQRRESYVDMLALEVG